MAAIDSSGARFLLAAETAHVMGVDMPDRQRVTTLAVREVQVHPLHHHLPGFGHKSAVLSKMKI